MKVGAFIRVRKKSILCQKYNHRGIVVDSGNFQLEINGQIKLSLSLPGVLMFEFPTTVTMCISQLLAVFYPILFTSTMLKLEFQENSKVNFMIANFN